MNWILYDTILVFFKTIVSVAVGSIGNNDTFCNAAEYIILIFGKNKWLQHELGLWCSHFVIRVIINNLFCKLFKDKLIFLCIAIILEIWYNKVT